MRSPRRGTNGPTARLWRRPATKAISTGDAVTASSGGTTDYGIPS